ncbi:hypothetical protein HY948_00125 [Candidatus Gottesmanbacteria bacterium]|nr:hypothetical protein [Candidatus Gottesmanbacteria bacterium]
MIWDFYKTSGQSGQSLVEAVVVIGVVTVLVTGIIVGTTASLRNINEGKTRSLALKYSQEGIEYARNLRNIGWTGFAEKSGVYCLDKTNVLTASANSVCPVNVDSIYIRSLTFTWVDPVMNVASKVAWDDGRGEHKSELTTNFTRWR